MKLFDYQTTLPHAIEDVLGLTVDLENAPHWHGLFTNVQQLTPNPIGLGSSWRVSFGVGTPLTQREFPLTSLDGRHCGSRRPLILQHIAGYNDL